MVLLAIVCPFLHWKLPTPAPRASEARAAVYLVSIWQADLTMGGKAAKTAAGANRSFAMDSLTRDDLRAAVAAGLLSEAQAAGLLALGEARLGQRQALAADEEPFELFRGFAEIFVSLGIVLLFAGVLTLAAVVEGPLLTLLAAAMAWAFALYFTRRRRMALPSIVLALFFAAGVGGTAGYLMQDWLDQRGAMLALMALNLAALAAYFRAFKVPFVAFLMGLAAGGIVFVLTDMVVPIGITPTSLADAFDLTRGDGLPLATLVFGLLALAAGLACDMKDPHRVGRWSATGFWLHILAAPALVNTLALTAYNTGGGAGRMLLALCVGLFALLALVIDRRSFLTAGVVYLGILIAWALQAGDSAQGFATLMIVLGGFLTFMGAFWTALRGRLMRALPDFPGKHRLPPWT